jgi:uncharacterized membrane protein YhdT
VNKPVATLVNRLHPLWGPVVDYLARVIEIPRNVKQGVMLGLDMVFVTVSMVVAYGYPFTPGSRLPGAVELFCAAITLAATALIFLRIGLYRAIIRFHGAAGHLGVHPGRSATPPW